MKTLKAFAIGVITAAATLAAAQTFSEATLQNQIQDINQAFSLACSGMSCYSVWNEQVQSLNTMSEYVDNQLPANAELGADTASLAAQAAMEVCQYTEIAPPETLFQITSAENRGLERLKTVQIDGGAAIPTFCTKVAQ